jgi:hypothetical protein
LPGFHPAPKSGRPLEIAYAGFRLGQGLLRPLEKLAFEATALGSQVVEYLHPPARTIAFFD